VDQALNTISVLDLAIHISSKLDDADIIKIPRIKSIMKSPLIQGQKK